MFIMNIHIVIKILINIFRFDYTALTASLLFFSLTFSFQFLWVLHKKLRRTAASVWGRVGLRDSVTIAFRQKLTLKTLTKNYYRSIIGIRFDFFLMPRWIYFSNLKIWDAGNPCQGCISVFRQKLTLKEKTIHYRSAMEWNFTFN